jgi:hypothetical protein
VAEEDSNLQPRLNMQHATVLDRTVPFVKASRVPNDGEPALNVVTVYQDPLTRYWATELWDRVGQLIHCESIRGKSWSISDLPQADVFPDAVETAVKADVLVISVRETGALPLFLHVWIDTWLPRRAGREGALVALIGVPAGQDIQSDRAYQYLESVARRAGLDFLPRERKLSEEPLAASTSLGITAVATPTVPLRGGASKRQASACSRW